MTLAERSTERRGMAARDERMVPVPYSPVMTMIPRIPMTSEPMPRPAIDWLVGSKPWYQPAVWWVALWAEYAQTRRVPTTVARSAHPVERRVATLAHSAPRAWRRPARRRGAVPRGASSGTAMVMADPFERMG